MLLSVLLLVLVVRMSATPLIHSPSRMYKSRSILPIPTGTSPSIADSIAAGTQLAIDQCQASFQWDRWNCPKTTFTRQQTLLPTKETAYAKAIVAAGIVYEITRNCSKGAIEGCGCDQNFRGPPFEPEDFSKMNASEFLANLMNKSLTPVRWSWGGCSDDPGFAIQLTLKFLNALDKDTKPAAYVARHNSKVGSEIVRSTMIRKCRCHGISGSCTLQTCWMQVTTFEEISRKLKERYRKSERLTYETVERSLHVENTAKRDVMEKGIEGMEDKLVFLEQSPDYCVRNSAEGIAGTKGRMCLRNANFSAPAERNSCRNLCRKCGHDVRRLKRTVSKRCDCTFQWCCEVKCNTCTEHVDEFFCV